MMFKKIGLGTMKLRLERGDQEMKEAGWEIQMISKMD